MRRLIESGVPGPAVWSVIPRYRQDDRGALRTMIPA